MEFHTSENKTSQSFTEMNGPIVLRYQNPQKLTLQIHSAGSTHGTNDRISSGVFPEWLSLIRQGRSGFYSR